MVRKAVVVAVCLILLVQPVAADAPLEPEPISDDRFEVEEVTVDEEDGVADVTVEYDVPLSVKLDTYLFGSGSLEQTVLDRLGIDSSDTEFERLDTASAEVSYDGEADEVETSEG